MIIRRARREDLAEAMRVIECGRRYMRACGNSLQWVNGYPTEAQILKEIDAGQFFVWEEMREAEEMCETEETCVTEGAPATGGFHRLSDADTQGKPSEAFKTSGNGEGVQRAELRKCHEADKGLEGRIHGVFSFILDPDPTYDFVEGGSWLNDRPYGTIHRMASDGSRSGFFKAALEFCMARVDNIRMDTHEINGHMRRLAETHGFTECGVIYVADGTPRVAYQLVVRES